LGNTQQLGSLSLVETPGRDELLDLDQEVSPDEKMLGLPASESEIAENVAGRRDEISIDRRPKMFPQLRRSGMFCTLPV
jgi:hypothetical protein